MSETNGAAPMTGDEALGVSTKESVPVEVVLRKPPVLSDLRVVFKDVYDNLAKGDRWEALVTAITSLDAARREADGAAVDYRLAKASAMLAATGKNAEQREAEVVLRTATEARGAAHYQRLTDSLEHLVIYLRGPASS